jgi:hypothetical protein
MNTVVFLFIGLYALLILVPVLVMLRKRPFSFLPQQSLPNSEIANIFGTFKDLSLKEKASSMIYLVTRGYWRKHILHNNAPKYDDSRYLKSYRDFLNNIRNIEALKAIKGRPF